MEPLAKFQQLQKIGEGGMGVVYRGWDPAIGRSVAIKFVRFSGEGNSKEREDFSARLRREGQAAGNLSHPNIVTIYDFVEQTDMAYIVMEFVDGQSLEAWLTDCELLGPHVVLDIIRQSATALDYAHGRGIIHRDVKPSNILIRNDGLVKLVDFGLAKVATSSRLTQTGSAIGTPHYMSAEQIDSDTVDARSDQYSLAVCTYEMMTGSRPFTGGSLHNLFNKILNSDPAPPPDLNPTLGREIGDVLIRALSRRPGDRYQSCLEFATALERACAITPSWRPKASASTIKTSPGRGGGGGGVAVETPMPTPIDLNKLAENLDPWLTEAISPRSVSVPLAPPQPPPAPPRPEPPAAKKYAEPAPPVQPPPAPPPEPIRRDTPLPPPYQMVAAEPAPDSSGSGKRIGVWAAIVLLAAALGYTVYAKFGAKPNVPTIATPAPVVIRQPAPEPEVAQPPRKTKAVAKRTAAPARKSKAEPDEPAVDPMNLLNRPANAPKK